MTDAIVSAVVESVATMIKDKIRYEVNLVKGMKKELLKLSKKLKTVREVLDDAENRGVKEKGVKRWLKELENTTYEMDDILDEWNYYSLLKHNTEDFAEPEPQQKISCLFIPCSCLSFNEISVRRDIAKKIEHVNAKFDQILKEKDSFDFVTSLPAPESHREPTTSSIDFKNVCGSDIYKQRDDIVRNMMHNGGETQILSIVGTGGLGKTTLAKLIFSDPQFDKDWLKIWVCVSHPFIVSKVANDIVKSATKETISLDADPLEVVLEKLKASVLGKKFLLVLDDVWSEDRDKWEPLKINLDYGAPGSKILVTTRNERVAKMMDILDSDIYHPKELSHEECWSLLCDSSGKSEGGCGKFEDVGKKIARKCKGLPLAAVVLGRLLRFKDLEGWKHVEKSEIWELDNEEVKIFPHLVLSYNELSPALKRCFSYCGVYPKDHQIHAESLIGEWMAQGYLGPVSGNGAVEVKGRECLNNLAMRSLFQDIEKNESGEEIESCKMHDIVHDFALYLRKNDDNETNCQVCDPSLASHVHEYRSLLQGYKPLVDEKDIICQVYDCMKSLRVLRINSCIPVGMNTLIHLRLLEVCDVALSMDDLKIICKLYFLQCLLLSYCNLTEIPREIGNLAQLRQLYLSGNEELKDLTEMYSLVELRSLTLCSIKEIKKEIGNLVKLRELNLSWNEELKELPESICSLVELQVLKIGGTDINYVPEALGELSNLTLELDSFKVGSQYNKLGFLKKLNCLSFAGYLRLEIHWSSMSEMVELVEDARQAQLDILLQNLQVLHIYFEDAMNEIEQSLVSSSSLWMELVEALVPHYNLKTLKIIGYKGYRLPDWMSSPLNFIKEIDLGNLSEVSSLPAMGKLPFLEWLFIKEAEQLKLVGREFLGIESSSSNVIVAFPKLKELKFIRCSKWEEWEDITEEEEESAAISIMPCLTQLTIYSCESLKKLPHRFLHKVSSSLQSLNIWESSVLVKTYGEDKEGSAWRSISQHNPQLQLQQ